MLWVLGFILSLCGLFVWLEFGTMIPRSGGEKVYLEAIYKKPKYLATVVFAVNAIILGFTAAGCIVSPIRYLGPRDRSKSVPLGICTEVGSGAVFSSRLANPLSILIVAGQTAGQWSVRGIGIGGASYRWHVELLSIPFLQ